MAGAFAISEVVDGNRRVALWAKGRLFADHALCEEVFEWFAAFYKSKVAQDFGIKSGVEQMHDGVFDAADVLINGHPFLFRFRREWQFGIFWVAIAEEIP